jgi:hypothetical protein
MKKILTCAMLVSALRASGQTTYDTGRGHANPLGGWPRPWTE